MCFLETVLVGGKKAVSFSHRRKFIYSLLDLSYRRNRRNGFRRRKSERKTAQEPSRAYPCRYFRFKVSVKRFFFFLRNDKKIRPTSTSTTFPARSSSSTRPRFCVSHCAPTTTANRAKRKTGFRAGRRESIDVIYIKRTEARESAETPTWKTHAITSSGYRRDLQRRRDDLHADSNVTDQQNLGAFFTRARRKRSSVSSRNVHTSMCIFLPRSKSQKRVSRNKCTAHLIFPLCKWNLQPDSFSPFFFRHTKSRYTLHDASIHRVFFRFLFVRWIASTRPVSFQL